MTTTTVQSRVELKYCVPELVAVEVLAEARHYLVPEPLARGPRQHITSLYLDTDELTFLRWHREGATERHKLRIRAYGSLPAATLYLELKSKNGQIVRKERMPFIGVLRDAVLTECRARYGATPQTLVNVVRESLRDPGLATAVTVDRSLRYQATTRGELVGDARKWRPLPLPPCAGPAAVLKIGRAHV